MTIPYKTYYTIQKVISYRSISFKQNHNPWIIHESGIRREFNYISFYTESISKPRSLDDPHIQIYNVYENCDNIHYFIIHGNFHTGIIIVDILFVFFFFMTF